MRENVRFFSVYIMTNRKNGVLHIGFTNDIVRRVLEHKKKLFPGFTRRYNLTRLVYFEEFPDSDSAITREKQLKGWLRSKKIVEVRLLPSFFGVEVGLLPGE